MKAEMGICQSDIAEMQTGMPTFQKQLAGARTEMSGLQSEIEQMKTEMGTFQSEIAEMKAEMDTSRRGIAEAQAGMLTFQNELARVKTEISGLGSEMKAEIRRAQSALEQTGRRSQQTRLEAAELATSVRELTSRIPEIAERHENDIRQLREDFQHTKVVTDHGRELARLDKSIGHEQTWNQIFRTILGSPSGVSRGMLDLLHRADRGSVFSATVSGDGVIQHFRQSDSPFNPRCIITRSWDDLFSFLDPSSPDSYVGSPSGEDYLEIAFASPITAVGLRLASCSTNFPRCFDIVLTSTDGELHRIEIRDADLNGYAKRQRYDLPGIEVRALKIEQKSASWDADPVVSLQSLDIITACCPCGFFRNLFNKHRSEVRKFVSVTSRDSEPKAFTLSEPRRTIRNSRVERIDIDLVDHELFLTSYSLTPHVARDLSAWTLTGVTGRGKSVFLDRHTESPGWQSESIRHFECLSGRCRHFHLVNNVPSFRQGLVLARYDIELFGILVPIK
jgi:archaellum component FlaC